MRAYQQVVDSAARNDTLSGAALAGMALILETGGGVAGTVPTDLPRAMKLYVCRLRV